MQSVIATIFFMRGELSLGDSEAILVLFLSPTTDTIPSSHPLSVFFAFPFFFATSTSKTQFPHVRQKIYTVVFPTTGSRIRLSAGGGWRGNFFNIFLSRNGDAIYDYWKLLLLIFSFQSPIFSLTVSIQGRYRDKEVEVE